MKRKDKVLKPRDLNMYSESWWHYTLKRVDQLMELLCWCDLLSLCDLVDEHGYKLTAEDIALLLQGIKDNRFASVIYVRLTKSNERIVDVMISGTFTAVLNSAVKGDHSDFWAIPRRIIGPYLKTGGEV